MSPSPESSVLSLLGVRGGDDLPGAFPAALLPGAWPPSGAGVHRHVWRLARLSREEAVPPEEAVRRIRAAMPRPPNPPDEVSTAVSRAHALPRNLRETDERLRDPLSGCRPLPRERVFPGDMGLDELSALSEVPVPGDPAEQGVAWLRHLFAPDEFLFVGGRCRAVPGRNLHPASVWVDLLRAGLRPGEQVMANPLTGREGLTGAGNPSHRSKDCVASCRHRLFECDAEDASLTEQAMLLYNKRREWAIRSIVWSGGRSLHALLLVPDCPDAAAWDRRMRGRLSRTLHEHWGDPACKDATRLSRFPGARRRDRGSVQRLLWLGGDPRSDEWTRKRPPRISAGAVSRTSGQSENTTRKGIQ